MFLGKVIKNLNKKYNYIKFRGISFNSKKCKNNDIFFAIRGNDLNGTKYIDEAIRNGAKVIISNLKFQGFNKKKILFIRSKNPRDTLSYAASILYKQKPKNIVAVTGTNGKTSIANFYYQILNLNKIPVASIGTLGVLSKKFKKKTYNTSIDPIKTHEYLNKLKRLNVNNIILEASSHGLKQSRLNYININTAIFTNLTRDHLDYHKTLKDYINSKFILFENLLKKQGNIIYNYKSKYANRLNKISKKKRLKKFNLGSSNSFVNILDIQKINNKKKITFSFNKKIYTFKTSLIGNIQILNLMYAIIAAYLSKVKINNILKTVEKISSIRGRLQQIGKVKNFAKVILDYAHTPDALKTVILNVKEDYPLSKISLVFGCGGNRDKYKRNLMGTIASKYCDYVYLTDDNPRTEDPKHIRNQIKKGDKFNNFFEIPSRSKAINKAVLDLKSGDILIVAGKGHENYQEYAKKNIFSDKFEILKSIKKKNKDLSTSIKSNIIKESFQNNYIKKNINIEFATINSKKTKKNSIFVGVNGKKFNGNLFAPESIRNGANLAISNVKSRNTKIIFQSNPLKIFSTICSDYRKTLDSNTIAITGSAGKTSVKELLGFCLNKLDKTYFSKNSFNNKYGVPLSLFNTPPKTKYTVLEIGMDKKGEINYLSNLIKPNLGLITNISYAHIKNFKNLDQIASSKGEIINNIVPGGIIVLNKDDKYYKFFCKKSKLRNIKIMSFSIKNKKSNVFFLNQKKINKEKYLIFLMVNGLRKKFLISKQLINYKENILASICIIANYFDINKLNSKLFEDFKIPISRGTIKEYSKKYKKINIIDESYNSNPLSFKFALNKFDKSIKEKNKKFILIGDMLELGKYSKKLHKLIAGFINKSKINKTYVYGNYVKHTFNKLRPQMRGKILKNKMEILKLINRDLPTNSYLMVKGSNSTGLNKIIQNL